MRRTHGIALLAAALAFASCGVLGPRTGPQQPQQPQRTAIVERVPERAPQSEKESVKEKPVSDAPRKEERAQAPRPQIRFSAAESAHVKAWGIHRPLPERGLTIDLDELRGEFTYPFPGHITSDYGMRGRSFHTGVDIKANAGDTIRAAMDGVVRMSKYYSGYGNIVVIRHYNGLETVYSHNTTNIVKVNDPVRSGQPIALAGRTGNTTGNHLHFEVRAAGEHFDPNKMLDCRGMCLHGGMLHIRMDGGKVVAYNDPAELDALRSAAPAQEKVSVAPVRGVPQSSAAAYHTVRQGDTLYALSRRYGTTVDRLCKLNGISSRSTLRIGQKIRYK